MMLPKSQNKHLSKLGLIPPFTLLLIIIIFKLVWPTKTYAQVCTSTTVDKTSDVKTTDTITITATADTPVDYFFFEIRNLDNPDGGGNFKPVCVTSGGDLTNPPFASNCPAGTHPLIFRVVVSPASTSGSRNISANEFFLHDLNIFQPYGARLERAQIVGYSSIGNGPWSIETASCLAQTTFYRPPVCNSSSISGNTLTPSQPIQVTINGTPPSGTTISGFTLGFYNNDNLYNIGNPKPIFYGGQNFTMFTNNSTGSNSHTFTINYSDLDRPDENWGNQYPVKIQVIGYFNLSNSGTSRQEANCIQSFTVQRATGTTPSLPPPGWYAPDGSTCNRTNYHTFYDGTSCSGRSGFTTENISPQSQCSTDGTGKCFKASGNSYNRQVQSYWRFDNQACIPVTTPYTPTNTFDTLYTCRFGIPPISSINGTITPYFTSSQQFDKMYVWLYDTQDEYSRFIELDKSKIISGHSYSYSFSNLFPDKKYDVYVKAYGTGGIFLDNITYEASCGAPACRTLPNKRVDFKLTFPQPLAGSSFPQVTNQTFQQQIDRYSSGQIGPIEMSLFIKQISRVPGLQKATCDPNVIGGCIFTF